MISVRRPAVEMRQFGKVACIRYDLSALLFVWRWYNIHEHVSWAVFTGSPICNVNLKAFFVNVLLLVRYVPNVTKRSIWDQCKKYILSTDRRPTDLTFVKISNGHISARGRPIHFMFGSTVGFSESADRMALIPVWPNSLDMWEKTMREE